MPTALNFVKHCSEISIPEGFVSVKPEGKHRPVNQIGLSPLSYETHYQVVGKYVRELSGLECMGRGLLGILALVSTAGLAALSPDVRDLFGSKATIRFVVAISNQYTHEYSIIERIGRVAFGIILVVGTLGFGFCDWQFGRWVGQLLFDNEKKYYNDDFYVEQYINTLIKFSDTKLLGGILPMIYKADKLNHWVLLAMQSLEYISSIIDSGDFEARKHEVVKKTCELIDFLIKNRSDKQNFDVNSIFLKRLVELVNNNRENMDLLSPIAALLIQHGANTKPPHYDRQAELDVIVSRALVSPHLEFIKAMQSPNSEVSVLPTDLLAKIHSHLLILQNPSLADAKA